MRFKEKSPHVTGDYAWERWFAFYPVDLPFSKEWAWLEVVERRMERPSSYEFNQTQYEYRAAQKLH